MSAHGKLIVEHAALTAASAQSAAGAEPYAWEIEYRHPEGDDYDLTKDPTDVTNAKNYGHAIKPLYARPAPPAVPEGMVRTQCLRCGADWNNGQLDQRASTTRMPELAGQADAPDTAATVAIREERSTSDAGEAHPMMFSNGPEFMCDGWESRSLACDKQCDSCFKKQYSGAPTK